MELIILYLTAALAISFLCSILEAVLLSTPMSFIAMKEKEGAKNAPLLMRQKQDIDKPISATRSVPQASAPRPSRSSAKPTSASSRPC